MIRRSAVLTLFACTVGLYAVHRLVAVPAGLTAAYFDRADGRGPSTTAVDESPGLRTMRARRPDRGDAPFAVEWHGFIIVPFGGTYTFRTISHNGSRVYVRGRDVVANAGSPGVVDARGSLPLDAGVHSIFIRYVHLTEDCVFELSWSRNAGGFEPIPAWMLVPNRVSYARAIGARAIDIVLRVLALAWFLLAARVALKWIARGAAHVFRFRPEGLGPALRGVLVLSAVLNAWGIWWAMPNVRGWAPDEVVPPDILAGLATWFAQGWHEKYPPFHYFVLAAADSPVLLLSRFGAIDIGTMAAHVTLVMIGRAVSLLFAAGTIVLVYRSALELYGHRGAIAAALTAALTVPFAYYAKLANLDVPYLFWFTLSLFAYIRILRDHRRRDYLVFALSAALAGCTKDQIWGAYFVTPLAILVARWRWLKAAGRPTRRLIVDRTILETVAVGVATILVADNVVFNPSGFAAHVRLLLGTPAAFQAFPRTAAGQLQLAWQALAEMRYMFGWPLAIAAAFAFASALVRRTTSPSLHWLLVPALSYYASFVGVILFYFDRYFFPLTLVLALYIGWWIDQFLAPGVRARTARLAAVAAAFAYSVVYVAAVDYAMTFDSRYAMSRWLHAHTQQNDVVASLGPLEYQAIANGFTSESVGAIEDVERLQPAFVVFNRDQVPFLPPAVQLMYESLCDERHGYRLAQTFRSDVPRLPGLHPDLGPQPRHGTEVTDLAMINPTMEVFMREDIAR